MSDDNSTHETDESSGESAIGRDPSQLFPPYVDSRLKFWIIPVREVLWFVPGILAGLLAFMAWGAGWTTVLVTSASISFMATVTALALVLGAHEFTSPRDILRSQWTRLAATIRYPETEDETAAENVAGVEGIHEDGTAKMADGRFVGLVEVDHANTDLATDSERNLLAGQLSDGIDEDIQDFDFRFFSTTQRIETEAITEKYEEAAFSEAFAGDEWASMRDLLHSIVEWTEDVDDPQWSARERRSFVVVEVHPFEVDPPEVRRDETRAERLVRTLKREENPEQVEAHERRLRAEVQSRCETVANSVIGGVEGLDAVRVGALAHAQLVRKFWTGTNEMPDRLPREETGRLADVLAPDLDVDTSEGFVRAGDEYCKTFWIAEWPSEPDAQFLEELVTMRGIDVDICIRARSLDKRTTVDELKHEIAEVDAEAAERAEETDPGSMEADDTLESLIRMFALLRQTNSQPWEVAMYVTVRVDDERATDYAMTQLRDGTLTESSVGLAVSKQRALSVDADRVRSVLEGTPADAFTMAPATRQEDLFKSCSPTGRDVYAESSSRDRYVRTLGGSIGAMFPFIGVDIHEEEGVEYGRSIQTGRELVADPFDRGNAPHQLTIATSGSGKTYSVGKRALRWWAADPERTLIFCDTMGGFDDVVDVANGDHIVVDGQQTINPLHLESTPEDVLDAGVDPYRMKVDEAREFIVGILREQGLDQHEGELVATVEEMLETTYHRAGITPDPETHGTTQVTMADCIETLADMLDETAEFTHTDHDAELKQKQEQASRLLDRLSGFKPRGKYNNLVGESDVSIEPGQVTYLDLQQLEEKGSASKSTLLHLMLSNVYGVVKRAPDKTMFVIDEAHYLLHSPEMVSWLQRAARHWRHHNASMWLVSQSPSEFVGGEGESNEHRETITAQCSTIEFYRTSGLDLSDARKFGMNDRHHSFVKQRATSGSDNVGYSQALVSFTDVDGWIRTQVAASPAEDAVLSGDEEEDEETTPPTQSEPAVANQGGD